MSGAILSQFAKKFAAKTGPELFAQMQSAAGKTGGELARNANGAPNKGEVSTSIRQLYKAGSQYLKKAGIDNPDNAGLKGAIDNLKKAFKGKDGNEILAATTKLMSAAMKLKPAAAPTAAKPQKPAPEDPKPQAKEPDSQSERKKSIMEQLLELIFAAMSGGKKLGKEALNKFGEDLGKSPAILEKAMKIFKPPTVPGSYINPLQAFRNALSKEVRIQRTFDNAKLPPDVKKIAQDFHASDSNRQNGKPIFTAKTIVAALQSPGAGKVKSVEEVGTAVTDYLKQKNASSLAGTAAEMARRMSQMLRGAAVSRKAEEKPENYPNGKPPVKPGPKLR